MLFRQLIDSATSTFTYLLADRLGGSAVLIDPVFEQHLRDLALLRELDLTLVATLDTHVHADHVTGAWLMKEALGSQIGMAGASGARGADRLLRHEEEIVIGDLLLEARATPGHTDGCMSFVCHQERMVFTGDALLIRGAGRTDFQQGSAAELFRSVRSQIFSLPDEFLVYPGHDYSGRTSTTVAEEKTHNPRLGSRVREEDFVGYMNNLGLPHPKKLDIALPANLRCGKPEGGGAVERVDWAPVVRTYAGVAQLEPEWLHAHLGEVLVLDVRETPELGGSPLGSIPGSLSIPLSEFKDRIEELPQGLPIVTSCPAGARSAIAATFLERAGRERVANLRGGLLEWRSLGLELKK